MNFRTKNPALNANTFAQYATTLPRDEATRMTLLGVVGKTALLLFIVFVMGALAWRTDRVELWAYGGAAVAALFGLLVGFMPEHARFLAIAYAVFKGMAIGALTRLFETQTHGIALDAVLVTTGVLITLLAIYRLRWITVDQNFRAMVYCAMGGLAWLYFITFVLQLCGVNAPWLHASGPWPIGVSLFALAIASFNLVCDFDFIEKGVAGGSPKHMEWYAGFGMLVSLVWLYLEVLRLLMLARRRK